MVDYEHEFSGLLPLVVHYLKEMDGDLSRDEYRGHSTYKIVGNVLAAVSESRTTPWTEWRAYDATNYRVLYSPELAQEAWDHEAVRVLVHEQLQRHWLEGEIETPYGKFYADDAMLILESGGSISAWSIMEADFHTELTPAQIRELREYCAEVAKDHEAFLIQCAENEYERRVDEYFSGKDEKDLEPTQ